MKELHHFTGGALRACCRIVGATCLLVAGTLSPVDGAWAQDLPQTPAAALAFEKADRVTDDAFYKTATPLPPGKPGELIRSDPTGDYSVGKGVKGYRILYHSRSATGRDVAASAAVLLPPGAPPAGGWPVIAWAHGTSGVAQMCAPSMMKDVYYGDEGLREMLQAGFAVVATDYAGLGTVGPHQYVDKVANAHDVINAVAAAQAAIPALGKKWVVDGHSQGGAAAWGVAEQEAVLKDANYLGAVSVAGAVNLDFNVPTTAHYRESGFYFAYFAYAVNARFPKFSAAEILAPPALEQYDALTTKGCWYYGAAVAHAGLLGAVVKPGWQKNKWAQKFYAENRTPERPFASSIFVIAGEADHSVPVTTIRKTVSRACKLGIKLEYRSYPGLDHDPTMTKSTPDQISWIKDRFAGRPASSNCAKFAN